MNLTKLTIKELEGLIYNAKLELNNRHIGKKYVNIETGRVHRVVKSEKDLQLYCLARDLNTGDDFIDVRNLEEFKWHPFKPYE